MNTWTSCGGLRFPTIWRLSEPDPRSNLAEASGSRNLTSMDKLVALRSHPTANLFSRGMSVAGMGDKKEEDEE